MPKGILILGLLATLRVAHWGGARDAAWNLCSRLESRAQRGETTRLTAYGAGRWDDRRSLRDVRFPDLSGTPPFAGTVWAHPDAVPGGARVTVTGVLRCSVPRRNPAAEADRLAGPGGPTLYVPDRAGVLVLPDPAPPIARLGAAFRAWVARRLVAFPGLKGLALAAWTGDPAGLPEKLRELYREGGLLHVLALSGQHVGALALVFAFGLRALGRLPGGLRPALWGLRHRVGVAAGVLAVTGFGLPPLERTLAMAAGAGLLRWRRLHLGEGRAVGVAAGLLLLWDPELLGSASFWLSCAGTAWLLGARGLAGGVLAMPLLMAPLSAYYFGRFSWLSPFFNAVVGGLWGVGLVPLGFCLPFLPALAYPFLESGWATLVAVQLKAAAVTGTGSLVVVRPTLAECLALQGAILVAMSRWRRSE